MFPAAGEASLPACICSFLPWAVPAVPPAWGLKPSTGGHPGGLCPVGRCKGFRASGLFGARPVSGEAGGGAHSGSADGGASFQGGRCQGVRGVFACVVGVHVKVHMGMRMGGKLA